MKRPELLLPAGSFDRMKTAFLYGADAVYCGTPSMSLRAQSQFTMEQVKDGVALANQLGKKVYLTLNLITHNSDLEKLPDFVKTLREIQPHGVIVADVAVFKYLRENAPELNLHVSTQSNVCSWLSVKFWEDIGAKMCVLAREVSISELKEIREKCPHIKLETFIHGSMCMSYSGRCLLSNFMADRGANQGKCAHSCRWSYQLHLKLKDGTIKELNINEDNANLFEFLLEEEFRPGEFLEIQELNGRSNILNSKDLCLLPRLQEFINSDIDCLKVEGRNKTQYYVAMVAKTYRQAIDDYLKDPITWDANKYINELYSISNRGFSLAFADDNLQNLANNYDNTKSTSEYEFAGYIQEIKNDCFYIEIKNKTLADEELEFICPVGENIKISFESFVNAKNDLSYSEINPGNNPVIKIPFANFNLDTKTLLEKLPVLTVIRKKKNLPEIEQARINFDKESFKMEIGTGNKEAYEIAKENFKEFYN